MKFKVPRRALALPIWLRPILRFGPLLALAGVSGSLLGGCGGDLGLTGSSGRTEIPSVTLPEVTVPDVTLPEVTVPDVTLPGVTIPTLPGPTEATTETTTSATTTNTKAPITTEAATTVVKTETETSTQIPPSETAVAAPTLAATTPEEPTSEDDNLWAWVALAVGLLVGAVTLAIVLWRRRREGGA